jgi:hypothetical protein
MSIAARIDTIGKALQHALDPAHRLFGQELQGSFVAIRKDEQFAQQWRPVLEEHGVEQISELLYAKEKLRQAHEEIKQLKAELSEARRPKLRLVQSAEVECGLHILGAH